MSRRLTGYTTVRDDDNNVLSFGPHDDVPAWAAKLITNPKLWGDGEAPESDDTGTGGDPAGAGDGGGNGGGQNAPEPPPKGGKGSGVEEWLIYAAYFPQVALPEDPSREDVIDALDADGIRTE